MHELGDVVASGFCVFTAFEEIDFDASASECPGGEEPGRAGADDGNARRNLTASEIGHLDAGERGLATGFFEVLKGRVVADIDEECRHEFWVFMAYVEALFVKRPIGNGISMDAQFFSA